VVNGSYSPSNKFHMDGRSGSVPDVPRSNGQRRSKSVRDEVSKTAALSSLDDEFVCNLIFCLNTMLYVFISDEYSTSVKRFARQLIYLLNDCLIQIMINHLVCDNFVLYLCHQLCISL